MKKLPWMLAGVLAALLVGCGSGDEGASDEEVGPEFPPAKTPTYKGEKVALKILLKPGRYRMIEQMSQKMTITIQAEGERKSIDNNTDLEALGDVVIDPPNAAGERHVQYTCTKVKMSTEAMGRRMKFDSSRSRYSNSRELRFLQTLIGRKLEQVYSRDGKFLRMDGLESVISQMAAAAGGQAQMEKMRKMLMPMFKEILTRHWGKVIPTKPVGPGDTWRCTMDLDSVPILGKLDAHFACRLQDIKTPASGPVAVIAGNVLAETFMARPSAGNSPFPENVDVEIQELRMAGPMVFHFDTDIGLSTALESRLDISGEMRITVEQRGQRHEAEAKLGGSVHIQAALLREGDTRQSPPKLLADVPRRERPSRYARPVAEAGPEPPDLEVAPAPALPPIQPIAAPAPRAAKSVAYPEQAPPEPVYTEPAVRPAMPAPPRLRPTPRPVAPAPPPAATVSRSKRVKIAYAKHVLMRTERALQIYKVQTGAFPTTQQGLQALRIAPPGVKKWAGPYVSSKSKLKDPWGRDYQYACPGRHNTRGFDLWSLGSDGVSSEDDITNWQR